MAEGENIDRLTAAGWRLVGERWAPPAGLDLTACGRVTRANGAASGFTLDDAIQALDMAELLKRQTKRKNGR